MIGVSERRQRVDKAFIAVIEKAILGISRSWLMLANVALGWFAGLPLAAPALMATGHSTAAQLIYTAYRATCHQLAYRSFFLFGAGPIYLKPELEAMFGPEGVADLGSSLLGNAWMGFKVAFCERNLAIYVSGFVAGVAFALVRTHLRPLPWKGLALALLPMAVDGFTQLAGWRESTWELRVLTGTLAGFGGVWFLFPRVERAMLEVYRTTLRQRLSDRS